MLTEPDMQARYVAAMLGVIEAELRKIGSPAANRIALFALGAAKIATRLADDLEQPRRCQAAPHSATVKADLSNVIAFPR
jgi:hypothetical protein